MPPLVLPPDCLGGDQSELQQLAADKDDMVASVAWGHGCSQSLERSNNLLLISVSGVNNRVPWSLL